MGKIFISHSSANNAEALAIHDWLAEAGWGDVFLDLDPRRGLVAGDRWQAALKAAAESCELILILISPEWARSKWCLAEFLLAKQMNKQILGVVVKPTPLADLPVELTAEWQLVDLSAPDAGWSTNIAPPRFEPETIVRFSGTGLARLRAGLEKAGLDATTFNWPPADDPDRAPYRGLLPLEAEDAGIFYGRDGAIILTLDALRGLAAEAPPRFATILGASGAGKSSFLRAGLLPRLSRDSRRFHVLPIIRPGRAALSGEHGFAAMLEAALRARGITLNRADLRDAVAAGAPAVAPLFARLVAADLGDAGSGDAPTLVIAVDQAEELLSADNAETGAFLALLAGLGAVDTPKVLVVFTVRSDSFDQLQSRPELTATQPHHLVDLPPVPTGSFGDIIRGPARRLSAAGRKLAVEETLVDALLGDIEKGGAKDALPLLAFTLERLFTDYGADGDLQLAEYEKLGRIGGAIEAAVESALLRADGNTAIPRDRTARLALLRRGLIPWLAGIDPATGSPRRRVARLAEVPAEARPLIDLLIEQRLLSADIDRATGERTVEPAHEALLRQWGALDGWLVEDSADLSLIEAVRRAATEWDASARGHEFLVHKGARLETARQLAAADKFSAYLTSVDQAYLDACRAAETAAAARARALRLGLGIAAVAVGVVLVAGLTAGWFIYQAGEYARRQADANFRMFRSEAALRAGRPEDAFRDAVSAEESQPGPTLRTAAVNAGVMISPYLVAVQPADQHATVAWMDDHTIALVSGNGAARAADLSRRSVTPLEVLPAGAAGFVFDGAGGGRVFFRDGSIEDTAGKIIAAAPGDDFAAAGSPSASADGRVVLFVGLVGNALLRDCRTLPCKDAFLTAPAGRSFASSGSISPDGDTVYAVWDRETVASYKAPDEPVPLAIPPELAGRAITLDASSTGKLALLGDGSLAIVDPAAGTSRIVSTGGTTNVAWSPTGRSLALVADSAVRIVDADGRYVTELTGNISRNLSLQWSKQGAYLATMGSDDPLRIWSPDKQVEGLLTVRSVRGPDFTSLAIDRGRGLVAAGDKAGSITLWAKDGGASRYRRPEAVAGVAPVSSLAFLRDGRLAGVYENSGVAIITPGDSAGEAYFPVENATLTRIAALDGDIRAVVPLTDKRIMALAGDPLQVTMVGADADALTPWGMTSAGVPNTAFVSHSDGTIRRRNMATGDAAETVFDASRPICGLAPTTDNNGARSLALSPDGKWLAATRVDSAVVVHNLADPARPLCLTLLGADSRLLAFSPDSTRLAVVSATDLLYVFDLAHPDSAVILGAQLVPDEPAGLVHPLGQDHLRQVTAIDWLDDNRVAVAAVRGQVLQVNLDPAAWRARVDSLFFTQ